MKIGTKGHYALLALIDLAEQKVSTEPVSLRVLAENQNLSLHYLEALFSKLKKKGIVRSIRGFQGGYFLTRPPSDISVWEIVTAVGEEMRVTRCESSSSASFCFNKGTLCSLHSLWDGLGHQIYEYLIHISLEDLVKKSFKKNCSLNFEEDRPT